MTVHGADRLTCPVCQARFRGATTCSRCGADLTPVMVLAAASWQARNQATEAMLAGDTPRAIDLLATAETWQATLAGRRLRALALLLK